MKSRIIVESIEYSIFDSNSDYISFFWCKLQTPGESITHSRVYGAQVNQTLMPRHIRRSLRPSAGPHEGSVYVLAQDCTNDFTHQVLKKFVILPRQHEQRSAQTEAVATAKIEVQKFQHERAHRREIIIA